MPLTIGGNTRSQPRRRKRPRDDGQRLDAENLAVAHIVQRRPDLYGGLLQEWARLVIKRLGRDPDVQFVRGDALGRAGEQGTLPLGGR